MYEILKARKEELGYTYEEIAEKANLPLEIVEMYFEDDLLVPRYISMRAICEVLFTKEIADKICEPEQEYAVYMMKKQGEYTIEDYFAWPEEQRIELIDGVIYDMITPGILHQIILGEILFKLWNYDKKRDKHYTLIHGPLDVQVDRGNKTMVQPDIMIVCDRSKFKNGGIYGAPDFIIEVLSPSTCKKDKTVKLIKYQAAGVREYWIVDPMEKKVIVYSNMTPETKDIAIYPFESKIPVGIYGGECVIDFAEIKQYISYMY